MCAALISATALTSCHDDEQLLGGEGRLMISATLKSDIKVSSRATVEEYAQSCLIYISNAKGPVRKFVGIDIVPAGGIPLVADHYIAQAWAGDSVPASFDDRWFKGEEEFDVTKGQTTNVNLVCKIANTAVSIKYPENMDELLGNYSMTVGHAGGKLTYTGNDTRRGYFMMTPKQTDLEYTLTGTKPDGTTYTRSGKIENAKPATEYILNVKYNGEDMEIGGAYFTIEIDEHAIVVEDEVIIGLSPDISGYDFDIDQPLVAEQGKAGRRSVMVYGSTGLKNVVLTSDLLTTNAGISGNDVDLLTMTDEVKAALENAGINFIYNYNEAEDNSWIKINFEENFLNALPEGTYPIGIHAVDDNNKFSDATFTLLVSNAPVAADDVVLYDVWATQATITGSILNSSAANPTLRYRAQGQTSWTNAQTTIADNKLTASLTGLTPGTTYEYIAATDDFESSDIKTFTTESDIQLPNASFENWYTSGKTRIPNAEGAPMFWDSGNGGSAPLMSVNLTDASSEKKHSGQYSAKLASQFVGVGALGAFAAGNIFVGEFIRTDGTNGVLGWGRSFTSRPKALKGYVHYTPQAITHTNYDGVNKGDMDSGIIYIAILDGTTGSDSGKNYPFIIKTKPADRQLFDKNAPNIIGYGELVMKEGTQGDAMVEFNIPIEYFRTDVKALNIAIVASASFYGDYFTGGPSVMYLDDLQLVY